MIARSLAGNQRPRRKLAVVNTSWQDEDFGQKTRRQSLQVPPPSQRNRKVSTASVQSVQSVASDGNERYYGHHHNNNELQPQAQPQSQPQSQPHATLLQPQPQPCGALLQPQPTISRARKVGHFSNIVFASEIK